jgi:hypothetical protein
VELHRVGRGAPGPSAPRAPPLDPLSLTGMRPEAPASRCPEPAGHEGVSNRMRFRVTERLEASGGYPEGSNDRDLRSLSDPRPALNPQAVMIGRFRTSPGAPRRWKTRRGPAPSPAVQAQRIHTARGPFPLSCPRPRSHSPAFCQRPYSQRPALARAPAPELSGPRGPLPLPLGHHLSRASSPPPPHAAGSRTHRDP